MNWAEERDFIPKPHWPGFRLWVACGGFLAGHYVFWPLISWVLQ